MQDRDFSRNEADANGRVTFGGHQGLHITYNLLNLPQSITTNDGVTTEYIYLSDGTKIYAGDTSDEGCGTCYRGSFVYAKSTVPSPADGSPDDVFTLQSVATPEGRVMVNEDGSLVNLWYAKDYLGSVRSVVSLSGTPQILEQNDYLPFGTRIDNPQQPTLASSRWRYAGKEEQAPLVGGGCLMLDFGFRSYDPWAARWTTPDPKADKYVDSTPFAYCRLNPINRVDPTGETDYEFDEYGNFTIIETEDPYDRIFMSNGKKMIVKDKSILANMKTGKYKVPTQDNDYITYTSTYTTTESKSAELIAVFAFLQENSKVEWGLYHGESGRSMLGTTKSTDAVDEFVLFKYDESASYDNKVDPIDSKIHGHPDTDVNSEIPSMEADFIRSKDNPAVKSFVYFPMSKNIYQVTPQGARRVSAYRNWSAK